jgi:hypothetical protein
MIEDLKSYFFNAKGFKSKKKIVVIESDDWGSVRMPSKKSYDHLLNAGIKVDKCGYNTFDSLESPEDLEDIFNSFLKIKDFRGNSPIITANTIMANPDYDKIRNNKFEQFYFEPFNQSYTKYQGNQNSLKVIQQGIDQKIYFPQLHGREHIFVNHWMQALRTGEKETMLAFNQHVYGLSTTISSSKRKSYLTALDLNNENEIEAHLTVLSDAQNMFKQHFGFTSSSFIAPNYTWHPKHEIIFKKIGIETIQGGRAQKAPNNLLGYNTIKHYMGKVNYLNQLYLVRNSSFEPSIRPKIHWQKKIIKDAKIAFSVGAPIIISSHRVNFMGGMVQRNRHENLKNFIIILQTLLNSYPDIEFMSTNELATHIRKSNQ